MRNLPIHPGSHSEPRLGSAVRQSALRSRLVAPLLLCLLIDSAARGVPLSEVPLGISHLSVEDADFSGAGDDVAYLVIDFRAAGGNSFAFGYRHEGQNTTLDMLESLAANGLLEVAYEDFSFGPAVRGIAYPREAQAALFPGAFGGPRSWVLWDGTYAEGRVEWSDAAVGINGVEFGNTEPTIFLPSGGFVGFTTWAEDEHPFPGPPPLLPLTGDFDSSGGVDGHDLLAALLGFGTTAGPTLAAGDADRDGDVDRTDILLWRENLGAGLMGAVETRAVPEPSSVVLILVGLTWLAAHPLRSGGRAIAWDR